MVIAPSRLGRRWALVVIVTMVGILFVVSRLALAQSGGPSAFCHVTDGQFTDCPAGGKEWSDVPVRSFPATQSFLYASQADLDPAKGSPLDTFVLMYDECSRTKSSTRVMPGGWTPSCAPRAAAASTSSSITWAAPCSPTTFVSCRLEARLVSVGRNAGRVGECDLDEIARKRARIIGVTFRTRSPEESLACSERFATHLLDAVTKGALKPVLDRAFPFERLADAHAYMLSDAQTGKIVLTMGHDKG